MLRLSTFQNQGKNAVRFVQQQIRKFNGLTIGVPTESLSGESRVALTPIHVGKLTKAGAKIRIQAGAGVASGFQDASYKDAGADIVDGSEVWKSKIVTKVSA